MKRTFWTIALVLVLSLSLVAVVACKQHEHTFSTEWTSDATDHWHKATCEHEDEVSDKAPHEMVEGKCKVCGYVDPNYNQGGGDAEIPVEEGKITFYCAVEGIDMPTYASPFLLGPYATDTDAWAPGKEMKNLEGTNIWYVCLDVAPLSEEHWGTQWNNYMVDLGYNASSGLPADKIGEAGKYLKSDETAAPGGMSNPTFEYDGGDTVNLGTQHFSVTIDQPDTIAQTTLRVSFTEELGANAQVVIAGGFNGWKWDSVATKSADDASVYDLVIKDVLCTDYTYLIAVCLDTTKITEETKDAASVFDRLDAEGNCAYIKIFDSSAANSDHNLEVSIVKGDNNAVRDLAGTQTAIPEYDVERVSLDITKPVFNEESKTWEVDIASYEEITLKIEFTEALAADLNVYVQGNLLTGWGTALKFESTDRKVWTCTAKVASASIGQEEEFKVVVIAGDFAWEGGAEFGVPGDDGSVGNAHIVLKSGENALFASAQTYSK